MPRELAVESVRYLQSRDYDVALSHAMKVDHGITIPLYKLTGALARYAVLPVFINCAADPRPSFRRVRGFGAGCWHGIPAMPAICRGGAIAIRIGCGSAR